MQGRRYAISLSSQVVIVLLGYKASPGMLANKSQTMTIHPITEIDNNRVEVRFSFPYGAVVPSSEKASTARKEGSKKTARSRKS